MLYIIKKLFILLLFLFCSYVVTAQSNNHIGEWHGKERGKPASIIFDEQGYAILILNNGTIGGKEFKLDGQRRSLKYSINYKTKPISVSFILIDLATNKEIRRLSAIMQFISNMKMQLMIDFEGKQPRSFENSGNNTTMTLTKVR